MPYRPLDASEIALLERQGCRGELHGVEVVDGFKGASKIIDCEFRGANRLGRISSSSRDAGLRHSRFENCAIGDNPRIFHATIASTDIGNNCRVEHAPLVDCSGDTAFANGLEVNTLTEAGGRGVLLWRRLSSPLAHLMCHLRGSAAGEKLDAMVAAETNMLRSKRSRIADGAVVLRAGPLVDVHIGPGAKIEDVATLRDCWVESETKCPARVGEGVAAEHCVFSRASLTEGGARLTHCFIGEGVLLRDGFSAEHSLFFANCDFMRGEAVSVMAGPFASSHHKSTLALTCQCSFTTFGSSANASNHHFKIGPVHGGVLRRGVKMGSGSYLFWPGDIGAFSIVTGRHNRNLDTTAFPFSLLLGEGGKTTLVPGALVFSAGLLRDQDKWRKRDNRIGVAKPLDHANSACFSPYALQAMDRGLKLIDDFLAHDQPGELHHNGADIPASTLRKAQARYRTALAYHIGRTLVARMLAKNRGGTPTLRAIETELYARVGKTTGHGSDWRDWGGMLLSGDDAGAVVRDIESGALNSLDALADRLEAIHLGYGDKEWLWLRGRWHELFNRPSKTANIRQFLEKWLESLEFRQSEIERDIAKEFAPESRYGFGVEGGDDFDAARRSLETHPLLLAVRRDTEKLSAMARRLLAALPR